MCTVLSTTFFDKVTDGFFCFLRPTAQLQHDMTFVIDLRYEFISLLFVVTPYDVHLKCIEFEFQTRLHVLLSSFAHMN